MGSVISQVYLVSVHEYLAENLELPMAYKKFGMTGSSGPILKLAHQALGELGGPRVGTGAVTNLGFDSVGGQHNLHPGANATRNEDSEI